MPRTRYVLSVLAVGVLMLAGCSSDEQGSPETASRSDKPAAKPVGDKPKPERKMTAAELKAAIGVIVLGEGDVGREVEVQDQDDSLDAPTNDICARKSAADGDRLARNQDFFWKSANVAELVVSNEAVAYQPGKGAAAFAEIKKAVGGCDGWEHSQGEMADVEIVDPPTGTLGDAFAWRGQDSRKGGTDYSYLAVYQRRGDLVSAVYVWSTSEDEAREVADEVAPKAAARLERAVG
ncbi:hypothetical protein ABN034_23305 [Actinopolymorpha sp. B11F2]|uniref:hypothetical protein n=1 Tax=Actinopolymorpha sp. B11F2 TaxID=3160862 RepID=UPI0032E43297